MRGKFNVVKRFNVSSLRKGREIASKGSTPEEKGLHFPEYACHGGGECNTTRTWGASSSHCVLGSYAGSATR